MAFLPRVVGIVRLVPRACVPFLAAAWVICGVWVWLELHGGSRGLFGYLGSSRLQSVEPQRDVMADTSDRTIWSGWWPAEKGFRRSSSSTPDIAFRWDSPVAGCRLSVVAFPIQGAAHKGEPLFWRLNDGAWEGPISVANDGLLELGSISSLLKPRNLLSLYLPNARQLSVTDLRILSIGLRSLKVACD